MREEYERARKLALRDFKKQSNHGEYPYLAVLDALITRQDIAREVNLGVVDIPLDLVVGTKTQGRTNAFASNFMPLLDEESEFAAKWMRLYEAQAAEGIRDPILAYEYMNRFYVEEGNKRVSILKYVGADSIRGKVIRMVPQKDDSKERTIYYEFLDFYQMTEINYMVFSEPGSYTLILKTIGAKGDWDDTLKRDFKACYERFAGIFEGSRTSHMTLTTADAFLVYLEFYGYEKMIDKSMGALKKEITRLEGDFEIFPKKRSLNIKMDTDTVDAEPNPIKGLLAKSSLKTAFLFDKTPETSMWTYNHKVGMEEVAKEFGDRLECMAYYECSDTASGLEAMRDAVEKGCTVIFATTPNLITACTSFAVEHPEVKILNCSLNTVFGHIKTYYGRLYEAKFLMGVMAGLLSDSDRIGYLADYPIYGSIANINAFAIGVSMVNPKAKIYLHWYKKKETNVDQAFMDDDITIVSGYDSMIPNSDGMRFGLYDFKSEDKKPIAMVAWNWSVFYSKMIHSIFKHAWNRDKLSKTEAINYWWGMNAGVIDFITSGSIPAGNRHLVWALKNAIENQQLYPFSNEIYSQGHIRQCKDGEVMNPYDIMMIDWLAENVVGSIPSKDELVDDAQKVVEVQGVKKEDHYRL